MEYGTPHTEYRIEIPYWHILCIRYEYCHINAIARDASPLRAFRSAVALLGGFLFLAEHHLSPAGHCIPHSVFRIPYSVDPINLQC
jgi:hypothetical protein